MDIQKIKALIELAAQSGLSELEFAENGCRLRVSRGDGVAVVGTPAVTPILSASPSRGEAIPAAVAPSAQVLGAPLQNAPMFGVFCLVPAPGEAPFVRVGDRVSEGQKLCMLEAMKQFHAVNADRDGTIAAILAENGQEVDAGQPLFRFE